MADSMNSAATEQRPCSCTRLLYVRMKASRQSDIEFGNRLCAFATLMKILARCVWWRYTVVDGTRRSLVKPEPPGIRSCPRLGPWGHALDELVDTSMY